ncbi:NfeD family protein [Clostridium sp. D2Q-11]|uniref:NfeD family protein n=1 Tax=Anaeromonas frigoriresistens TaxID=2683708 RepID=A0A942Z5X2_9FIRM|nr:NfeD family protein [Anaeromonas frigoriresistens]MBS4536947.1 NfeD family protein [Anaeromonas frigoriresistens]
MSEWWASIPVFEKVFWYLAIPSTVVFMIQLFLTFFGLGEGTADVDSMDGGFDLDADGDGFIESAFNFFTIRNFIIFFTVFGWSGIAFSDMGFSEVSTIVISSVLGIIVMLIVAALFYFIMNLASSGNIDLNNSIGATGSVYIPIPAKGKGTGKVQILIQDSLKEVEAITKGKAISTGERVKVLEILDNNILVVEILNN